MIKGVTFIWGKGIFYCGKHVMGTWFDHNDFYRKEPPKGFGIKFDITIGRIIRPLPYFWKPAFWKKPKPVIQDILDKGVEYSKDFFGKELYERILTLGPHHWEKRSIWNPWYALHWFVMKIPPFVWPYISIGTPWISFNIGIRALKVDPFTKDITWCEEKDRKIALKEEPKDIYYALCPTMTIRNNRE